MAKICYSCGKHPSFGNARSHSLRATRRRWNPNLQKIRIQEGSTTKRAYVCTSCLKAFKVQKATPNTRPASAATEGASA